MQKVTLKTTHITMESHLSTEHCHYSLSSCVILNDSHELKGKRIMFSVSTPKKNGVFGKAKTTYYIENSGKTFDSLNDLCNEYGFIIKPNQSE